MRIDFEEARLDRLLLLSRNLVYLIITLGCIIGSLGHFPIDSTRLGDCMMDHALTQSVQGEIWRS